MTNLRQTMEKAGLKFNTDGRDYAAIAGKSCFSHYLNQPNVFGFADLERAAMATTTVSKMRAGYQKADGSWVGSDDFPEGAVRTKAVVDDVTGACWHYAGDKFNPVQNRDVLMEAVEAARDLGARHAIFGSVVQKSGRLNASFLLADPDYTIPVLTKHDRFFMSGFNLQNSYRGDSKVRAEACGIDAVCCNFNLWGREVASFEATHFQQGDLTQGVRNVLRATLDKAPKVAALYEAASLVSLRPKEVIPVLAGAGFDVEQAVFIEQNAETLEPDVKAGGFTALNLNLAATAFVTHVAPFSNGSMRDLSNKANVLLHEQVDELHAAGIAAIKTWQKTEKLREARETAKKAAKALLGTA